MRILIGCEESQVVCKAFRARGHDAYSCDLKPCSGGKPEWHIQTDVIITITYGNWDLIILHPPCTYTAVCGNRWYSKTELREQGIQLCCKMWETAKKHCEKVVLEQPRTIMQRYIGKRSQTIHPFQFGHPERKETWLWLHGLPELEETNNVYEEMIKLPKKEQNKIWYMSPGKDRQCERSKTYPGIAEAMSSQWSCAL